MNRSGVRWTEAGQFLNRFKTLDRLEVAGFFTHLATADEADKSYVSVQLERFSSVLEKISDGSELIHTANSAAALAIPESHFDAVRPGLSLYGIYPASEKTDRVSTRADVEDADRMDRFYFRSGRRKLRIDI